MRYKTVTRLYRSEKFRDITRKIYLSEIKCNKVTVYTPIDFYFNINIYIKNTRIL